MVAMKPRKGRDDILYRSAMMENILQDNEKGTNVRSKNYKKCYLDYDFMKDFVNMKF